LLTGRGWPTLVDYPIDAPRPGRFQLAVFDRFGNSYATPLFAADSGATIERQLVLPDLPAIYAGVPLAPKSLEVQRTPSPAFPTFPDARREAGQVGSVRVAFIVDAEGTIEPGSFNVITPKVACDFCITALGPTGNR
jgi:hypothetical protein